MKILKFAIPMLLLGLILPISNLFLFNGTPFKQFSQKDPLAAAIKPILEKKCLSCHAPNGNVPFYASFPLARQLIHKDMREGTERLNLEAVMNPEAGKAVSEVALAKLEREVRAGDMPPLQFLVVHWDSVLSASDKKAIQDWINDVRQKSYATGTASKEHATDALQPIPDTVEADPQKVALGKKLYNDKRLSGDATLSCATCHDLSRGGVDRLATSTGINGAKGPINAPTVYNSGLLFKQFWDGRASDLKEQAEGPVTNPIEMGGQWPEIISTLNQDVAFAAEFAQVYPQGFSKDSITDAIAVFETTLNTPNSRFDRYLKGNAEALTARELEGYTLFVESGCATCHVGKAMGGQSFERLGLHGDYFADRGGPITKEDKGRFNVTTNVADIHTFKVPTLRNIDLTAPYFHDGHVETLADAVKLMSKYQTSEPLTHDQVEKIADFLKTLTGANL